MSGNRVSCSGCTFGFNIGPHTRWIDSPNIFGGSVVGNTAAGAYFLFNVNGAGTADSPIAIVNNTFGSPASGTACNGIPASSFVMCNDSVVSPVQAVSLSACLSNC